MVAAPRFTPELFICRAYERGCLPCEETAAALIFRGTESAGGFCTHLLATEHQEKDALEGMQDQRWSSIARTQPRGEAGPSPCRAGDAQAPKELLRAGDVINNKGHASDFYL